MRGRRLAALLSLLVLMAGCGAGSPVVPSATPSLRSENCRLPLPVVNIWPLVAPGTPWGQMQAARVLHVRVTAGKRWALLTSTAQGPIVRLHLAWNRGGRQEVHDWAYAHLSPSVYGLAVDRGASVSRLGLMALLALEADGVGGGLSLALPSSLPKRFSYRDGIISLFHHRLTVWYRAVPSPLLPPPGASDLSLTVGAGNPLGSPPRITTPATPGHIQRIHGWRVQVWQAKTVKGFITEAQWRPASGALFSLHGLEVPMPELRRVAASFATCPVRTVSP